MKQIKIVQTDFFTASYGDSKNYIFDLRANTYPKGGFPHMSEFKELIKSFSKSREYVRDFFVYGFKTREEFKDKSPRTYDNERRRIESWLSKFIKRDYTNHGKNISLAIDSNLLDTNPLYNVWKTKSFTDNDIMLHFFLLDCLSETEGKTAEELTDDILNDYGVLFEAQMIRRKCNEYEKEGLLHKGKRGREVMYYKNPSFMKTLSKYPALSDALKFYQLSAPMGFLGNSILDNISEENKLFRVKHSFFVHTLEDEILLSILTAIQGKQRIGLRIKSSKNGRTQVTNAIPLQIFISTRTGRRYLCLYYDQSKRFFCIRLDYIKDVKRMENFSDFDLILEKLNRNRNKAWGVSFQNEERVHIQHVKLTLSINEETEQYILDRLQREGKNGTITKIAENVFTYEKCIFDATEMAPWIRSFTGRIIDIEAEHSNLKARISHDLEAMYQMYNV